MAQSTNVKREQLVESTSTASTASTTTSSLNSLAAVLEHQQALQSDTIETTKSSLKIRRHSQSLRSKFHSHQVASKSVRVGFDQLEVVEFPVMLGEHVVPTIGGAPLALSREESARDLRSIDEYEETRKPRRSRMILKIPKSEREEMLRQEGIGSNEFENAAAEAERIRQSRKDNAIEPRSDLQLIMAESKRKLKSHKKKGWKKLLSLKRAAGTVSV